MQWSPEHLGKAGVLFNEVLIGQCGGRGHRTEEVQRMGVGDFADGKVEA